MALSFAFDGNTPQSYEQMQRKRKIAEALYAQASRTPSNVGEGLSALGAALGGRMAEGRANKIESAGREAANASFGQLFGGNAPSSPDAPQSSQPQGTVSVPSDIDSIIVEAAARQGVDPNAMRAIAKLESSFDPAAKNPRSSAGGLFQFIDSTAKDYGLENRFDPAQASDAAARLARDNSAAFEKRLGRAPTPGELYLMHQQGAGGALKLLSNPNARAVDIVGRDAVRLNGGNANMTAGEFANLWVSKADNALSRLGGQQMASADITGMAPAPRSMDDMVSNPQSFVPSQEQMATQENIRRNAQMVPPAMFEQSQGPDTQQAMAAMTQGMERARAPQAAPQANPVSQALQQRVAQRAAPRPAPQGQPWERGEMIDPVTGEYMQGTWNGQRNNGGLAQALMSRIQGRQSPQMAPQMAPQQPAQAFSAPQGAMTPQQPQTTPSQAPAQPQAMQRGQPSQQQLIAAMGNPFLTDAQRAMAKMMFERQYMQDPLQQQMSQLELQKRQLEIEQMQNPQIKPTDDIREYEFARQQGFQGTFQDYQTAMRQAGAQRNVAAPPPGYRMVYDQNGNPVQMEPIPGSPAALEAEQALKQADLQKQASERTVNVVTDSIDRALGMIEQSPMTTTGAGGALLGNLPGTSARDVSALLDTVKANAAFDTLQKMREASPTGGALGAVSERELTLLQSAIGNLEQSQSREQLVQNLNNVKMEYLKIIHGPEAAAQMMQPAQQQMQPQQQGGAPQGIDPAVWEVMTPEERALWQN